MLSRSTLTSFGAVGLACLVMTAGVAFSAAPAPDPPSGPPLLEPIDPNQGIPLLAPDYHGPSLEDLERRAEIKGYDEQLTKIRRAYFGTKKKADIRALGLTELREFTDPAAFMPMVRVLSDEADDVRVAMLDHFVSQGDDGQVVLAWIAMTQEDSAMRHEAERRLIAPAPDGVLNLLDGALRGSDHDLANAAGNIVGTLNIIEAIPTLIYAQAAGGTQQSSGQNIAWVFFGRQEPFVLQLVPIVGEEAGAFQPVIGTVQSGVVMEVRDAVVVVYRTIIHYRLVSMTTNDWGESTDQFGYNLAEWREWYNNEYVPYKNEQIRLAELDEQEDDGT